MKNILGELAAAAKYSRQLKKLDRYELELQHPKPEYNGQLGIPGDLDYYSHNGLEKQLPLEL